MEIISPGQNPEDHSAVFSCTNCGAKLRAKKSEGRHSPEQRQADAIAFTCPTCQKDIYVSPSKFNGNFEQG